MNCLKFGYDPLFKLLTDDTIQTVTMEQRYDIISFVVSMYYRNNAWNNFFNRTMDDILARGYHLTKANGKDSFYFEDQEITIAGKTLEQLQNENHSRDRQMVAVTALEAILKLTRVRMINDVINVVRTPEEVFTSDNPVIMQAKSVGDRVIPFDPNNTLSLPIDAHHVLQLQPWGHELDRMLLGRTSENSIMSTFYVEANNQFQYRQPGLFLLGTEGGLKSFIPDPNGDLFLSKIRARFAAGAAKR